MPSTYEPIATSTLGSAASSVTFSSIPSTYTDLVLILDCASTIAGQEPVVQVNGDTGTNYSITQVGGNGSSASSFGQSNVNWMKLDRLGGTTTTFGYNAIVNFMNYSNTTTNKTVLARGNNANYAAEAMVYLWRNTAAISSMVITCNTSTFITGSTFTLYGIKAA